MLKNIFKIIIVFVFGMAGGLFSDQVLWPYFVNRPLLNKYQLGRVPANITQVKNVNITESVALHTAIKKIRNVVVGIRTKTKQGNIIKGSGLIVTSDGLVVTLADIVPQGSNFSFFVNGRAVPFQILKRDLKDDLALVKLNRTNLSTTSFGDINKIEEGERVFLLGMLVENNGVKSQEIVNEGIIKYFTSNSIHTNMFEKSFLSGSPLFDISGDILGLNRVDSEGKVITIPISKIEEFIGVK